MKGAEIVVLALQREGVDTVFAYPGGASMELHQAMTRMGAGIRVILPRHEQGGVFAAEGYARASGRVGVCMATSGPGATNLITGIADAYMDSVPIVAITGQVASMFIGKNAFQETDVVGLTRPIVKHNFLVTDVAELPRIIKEAFYIASTGRHGPVVIDIPKDLQQSFTEPDFPDEIRLRGYNPQKRASRPQLEAVAELIANAERPVVYCGGGIISSGAHEELLKFAETTGIPVATTLMGIGAFPEDHPLSLKWLGMHGTVYANFAVAEADLLLAFGVRFDDRVTGKVEEFAKHGTIVHIDIDPSEINKNRLVQNPIVSDIRFALEGLNGMVGPKDLSGWHERIAEWKRLYPLRYDDSSPDEIPPQKVIETICRKTRGEAIVTTGVGQHQMWSGQFYTFRRPRTFLTSAGLGSMGFGLPAAIGAKMARPDETVIDIDGDGSFLMNVQELATLVTEDIDVKAVILNNQHLGMVVQWEDRFYEGNRGHTYIGNPHQTDVPYPDFVAIAAGFGVGGRAVRKPAELDEAIDEMLAWKGPYVLDVLVPYREHVLPMIPAGKTARDIIIE